MRRDRREPSTLRILLLEDDPLGVELEHDSPAEGGLSCEIERVQTRHDFAAALQKGGFDLILADYVLPGFDGLAALEMSQRIRPEVPFIIISGALGEDAAIEAFKRGATDYVLKHRSERLVPAVRRAISEAEERSERERALEALRRSEQEFRAMFDLVGVGKAQGNPYTGRFLRVNRKLCEITGYSVDEMLELTFSDLTHPEDREKDSEEFQRMISGEYPEYSAEKRYVRKNGIIIWVEVNTALVRDESGRTSCTVATVQDITARKRTEVELVRLASFPEFSPDLIVEITVAGEPTYLNPAARERFPDLSMLGRRHPVLEGLPAVKREIKESGGQPVTREIQIDGRFYRQQVFPVPDRDLLRFYTVDATEQHRVQEALRQSEQLYRTVVEQSADSIFIVDAGTKHILEANASLHRSLGYAPNELKNLTLYDLVAHDPDDIDINIRRVLNQKHYFVGERRYRRKDDFLIDVEVTASAVPYNGKEAMCVVAHDLTRRNRSEEELRNSLSVLLALREAGQVLGSTLQSEEIVLRLLEIMRGVAGLTAAVISRTQEDETLRVWRSDGLEDLWPRIRFSPEAEVARQETLESQTQRLIRLRNPGYSGNDSLVVLFLPLSIKDRVVGVLEAYGSESLVQNDTAEVLSSLSSQAASALENAHLYEELADRERALQDLIGKLLGAQEEERRRVSYEVHDGLAQVAAAAHQHLQSFARRYPPETEKAQKDLQRILKLVRGTVSDARRIIANLRPTTLDDLGLVSAISLEVERLREEGYRVDYETSLGEERLPETLEIPLYRIIQEMLTNMRKHARARRVCVELRRGEEEVRLLVSDDGQGFDPAAPPLESGPGERVGLVGMHERIGALGGRLEIDSRPGAGTSLTATIPLTHAR
jgi:PAS domain S-box-containing protein